MTPSPRLRLRIVFGPDAMLGPGKADLLDLIAETGSIAAAAKRMGMSYKRAWTLVEQMNAAFRTPLVVSTRGGPKGGGAQVSPTGVQVLAAYRRIEGRLADLGAAELTEIGALLRDMSDGK